MQGQVAWRDDTKPRDGRLGRTPSRREETRMDQDHVLHKRLSQWALEGIIGNPFAVSDSA